MPKITILNEWDSAPQASVDQNTNTLQDFGTYLKTGALNSVMGMAGLADMALSPFRDADGTTATEFVGQRLGVNDMLKRANAELSNSAKQAMREQDEAWEKGSALDIALSYLKNPVQSLARFGGETVAPMVAAGGVGGLAGRAAGKAAMKGLADKVTQKGINAYVRNGTNAVAARAAKERATLAAARLAGMRAGKASEFGAAVGEGALGGGMTASDIVQYNLENGKDPYENIGLGALSGVLTGGVAGIGAKLGGNVEAALFNRSARDSMKGGWRGGVKTALAEGAEEVGQAPGETITGNLGTDQPWSEGLTRNIVESGIAGAAVGGATHAMLSPFRHKQDLLKGTKQGMGGDGNDNFVANPGTVEATVNSSSAQGTQAGVQETPRQRSQRVNAAAAAQQQEQQRQQMEQARQNELAQAQQAAEQQFTSPQQGEAIPGAPLVDEQLQREAQQAQAEQQARAEQQTLDLGLPPGGKQTPTSKKVHEMMEQRKEFWSSIGGQIEKPHPDYFSKIKKLIEKKGATVDMVKRAGGTDWVTPVLQSMNMAAKLVGNRNAPAKYMMPFLDFVLESTNPTPENAYLYLRDKAQSLIASDKPEVADEGRMYALAAANMLSANERSQLLTEKDNLDQWIERVLSNQEYSTTTENAEGEQTAPVGEAANTASAEGGVETPAVEAPAQTQTTEKPAEVQTTEKPAEAQATEKPAEGNSEAPATEETTASAPETASAEAPTENGVEPPATEEPATEASPQLNLLFREMGAPSNSKPTNKKPSAEKTAFKARSKAEHFTFSGVINSTLGITEGVAYDMDDVTTDPVQGVISDSVVNAVSDSNKALQANGIEIHDAIVVDISMNKNLDRRFSFFLARETGDKQIVKSARRLIDKVAGPSNLTKNGFLNKSIIALNCGSERVENAQTCTHERIHLVNSRSDGLLTLNTLGWLNNTDNRLKVEWLMYAAYGIRHQGEYESFLSELGLPTDAKTRAIVALLFGYPAEVFMQETTQGIQEESTKWVQELETESSAWFLFMNDEGRAEVQKTMPEIYDYLTNNIKLIKDITSSAKFRNAASSVDMSVTYSKAELTQGEPKKTTEMIAKRFGVTVPYLEGFSDESNKGNGSIQEKPASDKKDTGGKVPTGSNGKSGKKPAQQGHTKASAGDVQSGGGGGKGQAPAEVPGGQPPGQPPSKPPKQLPAPKPEPERAPQPEHAQEQAPRETAVAKSVRDYLVSKSPASWKPYVESAVDWCFKHSLGAIFTHDLVQLAIRKVPVLSAAVRAWEDAFLAMENMKNKWVSGSVSIYNNWKKLSPEEQKEVDSLLAEATQSGSWLGIYNERAFDNDYDAYVKYEEKHSNDGAKVRFNQLSEEAQKVIEDVLDRGIDFIEAINQRIEENIDAIYAPALAKLTGKAKADLEAQIEKEKAANRQRIGSRTRPYAPLRRFGTHMVIVKSEAYKAAEKKVKEFGEYIFERGHTVTAAESEEYQKLCDELNELKRSEDDYIVEMAESGPSAIKRREELKKQYPNSEVVSHEKRAIIRSELPGYIQIQNAKEMVKDANPNVDMTDFDDALNEMYVNLLSENNLRRRLLRRKNIAGFDGRMMDAFLETSKDQANYLAQVAHSAHVKDAMADISQTANSVRDKNSNLAHIIDNEFAMRTAQMFERQGGKIVNKALRATSVWTLLTNPSFYLQNLSQPFMMTLPFITGKYTKSTGTAMAKMTKYMSDVFKWSVREGKNVEEIAAQFPADIRIALIDAFNNNLIDTGIMQDFGDVYGSTSKAGKVFEKASDFMSRAARHVETINRVASFVTAYETARENGASKEDATSFANDALYQTHGVYSSFNAPRYFKMNGFAKMATQFRKFQLIQAGMMCKALYNTIKGEDAGVQAVAKRQLLFTLGVHFMLTGLRGTPFIATLMPLVGLMGGVGDDDDDVIRKAVNDKATADLLVNGVPTLLGVNLTSKIGAGNMLSPLGFWEFEPSKGKKNWSEFVGNAIGPVGTLGSRAFTGMQYLTNGSYMKAIESFLPNGLASNLVKAMRLNDEGLTSVKGDVMIGPEEFDWLDGAVLTFGIPSNKLASRSRISNSLYRHESKLTRELHQIKQDFADAFNKHDPAGQRAAISALREYNKKAKEALFGTAKVSELYDFVRSQRQRARKIENGVHTNKKNAKFVKAIE